LLVEQEHDGWSIAVTVEQFDFEPPWLFCFARSLKRTVAAFVSGKMRTARA
jgi:hypothetical protein